MTAPETPDLGQGLGNRILLDKIDKLRGLGVSDFVPLPQMVLVGDQSAIKSSVLESLTGFQFPRSVSLCTRHATEIVCRRHPVESVVVSITPHPATTERAKLARAFRRETSRMGADEFQKIFEDAAAVMGIKSGADDIMDGRAFSRDVLRVEISGPQAGHLTIIDVPGMFEVPTPGLTTERDIGLVQSMVKRYMEQTRTIILAVVPCTGDIANQKILRLAAEADPGGKRTFGLLTHPDLAWESATKAIICDIRIGKYRNFRRGGCFVRNFSEDDTSTNMEKRSRDEDQFLFPQEFWSNLPADRLGVPELRHRIQQRLMDRTKSEFPAVRNEISSTLKKSQQLLDDMGDPRATTDQQRAYLGKIASKFMRLKNYGLDAYYSRDEIFDDLDLRLITKIRSINDAYSQVMHLKGHTREFDKTAEVVAEREGEKCFGNMSASLSAGIDGQSSERAELYDGAINFDIPSSMGGELDRVIGEPYFCPDPLENSIMDYIKTEYLSSRGSEIGNFSNELLSCTFKAQAKKWKDIARAHVANAVLIIHSFIYSLVKKSCPNSRVHRELWDHLLESLQPCYTRAMDHVEFLISVEFQGKPITYNPFFEKLLSDISGAHIEDMQDQIDSQTFSGVQGPVISAGVAKQMISGLQLERGNSVEAIQRKIHDVLYTYYDIARSRFVDVVCQQAIDHYLLHAPNGPLSVLSDRVVFEMTPDQLESIAGEDMISQDNREWLSVDVDILKKALRVLRG